jgi:riboflavin synthase
MFTGLVEEQGHIMSLVHQPGHAATVTIAAATVLEGTRAGDSISVNGVCLTVSGLGSDRFTADVMAETLERTTLGAVAVESPVNLERAMLSTARLGGHLVQGHVDGVGEISRIDQAERWTTLTILIAGDLAGYVAEKGSIAVDGVSLTVTAVSPAHATSSDVPAAGSAAERSDAPLANTVAEPAGHEGDWFQVSLIPTTQAETTFGAAAVGRRVNLEVDVIAKYVERLLAVGSS